jgi:hypothetical protein
VSYRLTDQGFERDVTAILKALNATRARSGVVRHNVLLSATLTDNVKRLADMSLINPVIVDCTAQGIPPASLFPPTPSTTNPPPSSSSLPSSSSSSSLTSTGLSATTRDAHEAAMNDDYDESLALIPQGSSAGGLSLESSKDTFGTSSRLRQFFLIVPAKMRLVSLIAFLRWKLLAAADGKVHDHNIREYVVALRSICS